MLQTDVHRTGSNHQIKWSAGCHAAVWFRIVNNKVCLLNGVHYLEAYWRTTITSVTNDQQRLHQLVRQNMAEFDWNLERHSNKNAASPWWLLYGDWMVNEMVRKKVLPAFLPHYTDWIQTQQFFLALKLSSLLEPTCQIGFSLEYNASLPVCGPPKSNPPHYYSCSNMTHVEKKIFSNENCELMYDSTLGHFI